MKLSNCTARIPHWFFGTLTIEDMGAHWRFSARLLGFEVTWFRKTNTPSPMFRACMKPSLGVRYVGTPMNGRGAI